MLTFLVQLGRHFRANYVEVIGNILAGFYITPKYLSYFITDNKLKNNIILEALSKKFDFNKDKRRRRCAYYIFNLIIQQIIWGKDKDTF